MHDTFTYTYFIQDDNFDLCVNWQYSLQKKMPEVKSVISKVSNAKADHVVEHGDKIYFGDLFLEVGPCCL